MTSREITLLTKRADLVTNNKVKLPGLFIVQQTRVCWEPNENQSSQVQSLVFAVSEIKGTQKAKGKPLLRFLILTQPYTFEFENEADRDAVVDAYTKAGALNSTGPATADPKIAAERKKLLENDPDLTALHRELVDGGIFTAEEFWNSLSLTQSSSKAPEARGTGSGAAPSTAPAGQRQGISNRIRSILSDVNLSDVRLTPDLISAILAEKPAVKRAYIANVPSNMSEADFWTRYFKYEKAKENRRKRLTYEQQVDVAGEDHAEMFEDPNDGTVGGLAGARRRKKRSLQGRRPTPIVDLVAQADDEVGEGYGTAHPSYKDLTLPPRSCMAEDLMHLYNQHADIALQGVIAHDSKALPSTSTSLPAHEEKAEARLGEEPHSPGLEDLKEVPQEEYEVLHIQDPRRYFDSGEQGGGTGKEEPPGAAAVKAEPAARPQTATGPQLKKALVIDPNLAYKVLLSFNVTPAPPGEAGDISGVRQHPERALLPAQLAIVRAKAMAAHEVMRHAWRLLPTTSVAAKEKLAKLRPGLEALDRDLDVLLRPLQGPPRTAMRQLIRPVKEALNATLEAMIKALETPLTIEQYTQSQR